MTLVHTSHNKTGLAVIASCEGEEELEGVCALPREATVQATSIPAEPLSAVRRAGPRR